MSTKKYAAWNILILLTLFPVLAHAEIRQVRAGGNLHETLAAANPGDEVVLEAKAVFTGNFTLPPKPFGPAIVIRSSATLPNRRITPMDAPLMPTITSGNGAAALAGTGTGNWVLRGLRFEPNVGGHGDVIQLQDVENIMLDRILLVVPEGQQQKRGVRGNGKSVTLTQSHVAGVWRDGQDSQAFCAWDGAGPYTITDNYLEAASENVMFGGNDSKGPEHIPADILVEGNHFSKPLSWKGQRRNVKNLFELKQAKRVVIRKNLFEHNWTDGQTGWAIVFKPMNDTGGSPWAVTEDVLFENNIIRDVQNGISLVGYDPYQVSGQMTRITIRNIVMQVESGGFKIGVEVGDVTIDHITMDNPGTAFLMYLGNPMTTTGPRPAAYSVEKLNISNSLMFGKGYGIKAEGAVIGAPSLAAGTKSFTFVKNVVAGGGNTYPIGTFRPTEAELRAMLTLDYKLIAGSKYKGVGTDGLDLGAILTIPWPVAKPDPEPTPEPTPEPEPEPEPLPVPSITFEEAKWTFGPNKETLRDGVRFANGSGTEYLVHEAVLYVLGTDARWYKKVGSSWVLHGTTMPGTVVDPPPPPPPPPPPSDSEGPVITFTVTQSGSSHNYTLVANVQDPAGVKRVDFYIGSDHVGFATAPSVAGGSTYEGKAVIRQRGTYIVRAIAMDLLGNTREATKTITR